MKRLRPNGYISKAAGPAITIHASAHDAKCFAESLDAEFSAGFAAALEDVFERKYGRELADYFRAARRRRDGKKKRPRYYPLLRFELHDPGKRLFQVKRIAFTGDEEWCPLEKLTLPAAILRFLPHLGRDSFFDLL